jgi:hypothetical protein
MYVTPGKDIDPNYIIGDQRLFSKDRLSLSHTYRSKKSAQFKIKKKTLQMCFYSLRNLIRD